MASKPAKKIRPGDRVVVERVVARTSFEADGTVSVEYADRTYTISLGPEDGVEVIDGPVAP